MRGEAGVAIRKRAVRIAPNRTRVVAGTLVLVVSTIAGALLLGDKGVDTQIYVVSQPLIAGQIVEAGDLASILVDGTPRFPVVVDPSDIVGQTLLQDLPKGTVLNLSHVAEQNENTSGEHTIGLRLTPGSYPNGVRKGDSVLVIVVPSEETGPEALPAVITHISEQLNSGGDVVVTLRLSPEDALLAALGKQGELVLIGVGS